MCMQFGSYKLMVSIGKTWKTRGYYCEEHVEAQEQFFKKKGKSTDRISVKGKPGWQTCSKFHETDKNSSTEKAVVRDDVGKYISGSDEDYKSSEEE